MQIEQLTEDIRAFVQSKGWDSDGSARKQTPRNLAISISIEASELLECFQWSESAERSEVESEIADVLIYVFRLADVLGVNPGDAIYRKLAVNRARVWPKKPQE
jgi:NTP pyrophosphatase (non-canonical NTP hydrolase)